ncbi:MAG: LD-carboxypeptidase [Proteobacteria bacterium]|nr:LD-carboxypeptidase [Pseudomonadota bacterium]
MNATVNSPLLPPALKAKDVIGLAPLAGPHQEDDFHKGTTILREFGFQTKTLLPGSALPFLAGSDQERLEIFHELWQDPEVKAIMAIRGGYGTLRLLGQLDYDIIKETPKILIGFSDISALLNVITAKTGLITFHGPNLTTLARSDKHSLEMMLQSLTQPIPPPLKAKSLEIIRPGTAKGFLVGGNLATMTHLLATPFQPRWQDSILFLEDIGEAPYRIDRFLTQLSLAGLLSNLGGIILGRFTECGDQEMIWQRVAELTRDENIPIWGNFPVGHGQHNMTMPIGSQVVMDSNSGTLSWTVPCHDS